jgi:two-component system cell cycle response regulator
MGTPTVLVIEDNEMNMKLVRSLLMLGRCRVLEAVNAEDGIQLAREHNPELILMDIQLPGMDGLSATRIIKKDPALKAIPVVALTSYAMQGDNKKASEAGFDAYITKPIDTRSFLGTVKKFCTNAQNPTEFRKEVESQKEKNTRDRARILIVDDDPRNVKLLSAKLAKSQYEILQAYGGMEALEKAIKTSPDLILLDIMMADLNGYEVTKWLRNESKTAHIPVILITGMDSSKDKIQGFESGAEDFLSKPVNTFELLARVKSMLQLRHYQEQLLMLGRSEKKFAFSENQKGVIEPEKNLPRVLLVKDDEKDTKLIKSYLHSQPYHVMLAGNGKEALDLAITEKIDLILLDIMMPGVDGFKTCKRLKEMDETRNIQIILITNLSELEDKIHGFESGADDFLFKPINSWELLARIKVLLKKKSYLDKINRHYEAALSSAITDRLTGLYNRAYLNRILDLEVKRSLRHGYQIALIMIELDDFKIYNDSQENLAGDTILRELAKRIRKNIREIDLATRYGGEKFVIVLPYTDREGALGVAERILEMFRSQTFDQDFDSLPKNITASISIALCPTDARTKESLIHKADTALYRAKKQGKNQICVYENNTELNSPSGATIVRK